VFVNLKEIPPREIIPGFHGRLVHSDAMTVAHWEIEAGSELREHAHPQEMIINLMEGQFQLTVAGQTRLLTAGDIVVIPGGVPHAGKAMTHCRIIDVWHPPRDDYR
jgi:quercetin dioxygenase-like cupin family protein